MNDASDNIDLLGMGGNDRLASGETQPQPVRAVLKHSVVWI